MTLTTQPSSARPDTAAAREMQANLRANLNALVATQPRVIDALDAPDEVEFVYARDGALTARIANGWWSRCSVPRLAAAAMLKQLEPKGAVACFLAPTHASQLRVALDMHRRQQAIVAVVPDARDLSLIVHCHDFSRDIASHRLWFVCGDAWERELLSLFDEQIGLAMPARFIRVSVSGEDIVASMIERAQRVFSEVAAKRSAAMAQIRATAGRTAARRGALCVVAPSQFRLWNDIGGAMLSAVTGAPHWVHFDPDDPVCSSPLAFAEIIRGCSAVFTANTSRGDLPGIVNEAIPWITWITTPRIPSFTAAGATDHLLLADAGSRDAAMKCGWPAERVHSACWPPVSSCSGTREKCLAIVADTHALDQPKDLAEYSSHGLLWDFIRDELAKNPFCLNDDVQDYLVGRMRRLNIADDGFPHARFIDRLIVPAFQQSIARLLVGSGIPLRLYGHGWNALDEFRDHARGAVHSRDDLLRALASVQALVNIWPVRWIHPSEFAGVPIIPRSAQRDVLLGAARNALAGKLDVSPANGPVLCFQLISRILASC